MTQSVFVNISYVNIIPELYRSTKSYISGKDSNSETFKISSDIQMEGNDRPSLFKLFWDYSLNIYKHRYEEMGNEHLTIS